MMMMMLMGMMMILLMMMMRRRRRRTMRRVTMRVRMKEKFVSVDRRLSGTVMMMMTLMMMMMMMRRRRSPHLMSVLSRTSTMVRFLHIFISSLSTQIWGRISYKI